MEELALLKQVLSSLGPLPEADWQSFKSCWQHFSAKRKEILTAPGEKEKYLYFVTEGVQRVFYADEENREATLVFTYTPSFGGVLDALMLQENSAYYYETLTPSSFIRCPAGDLLDHMQRFPSLHGIITTGITRALSGLLERQVELQCFSSEEKFKSLLKRSPHILQLVPHRYLANYIGIDPANFSKLINKIRI